MILRKHQLLPCLQKRVRDYQKSVFIVPTGQTQLLLSSLAVKNVDTKFIVIVKTSNFKFNKLADRKSEFVELSLIL
jgi:hypothetical protein